MQNNGKEGILVISAGIMQIPAIKTAKKLGLRVIATDRNPEASGFVFCDEKIILDSKDVEGHVQFARKNRERLNICAAFAGSDVAVTVAAVTSALSLPGITVEVAERSNNKAKMKQRWLRDGVPTPYGEEALTLAEAKRILMHVGLPAIVKAVDNAASRGSMKIDAEEQLPQAFANAKAASRTGTAIVEEYVVGYEQSVETIVWRGRDYHVGMVDRQFGFHPYHIETAHIDPSVLPAEQQIRTYEVVDAAADSLGIDFGPAKADMIWTEKGPMILEMPARLSGGFHSQYTTPLSSGKDPIRAVMEISLGRPLDEWLILGDRALTSICAGIFPPKGRIKAIHGINDALAIKGVEEVIVTKRPGEVVADYIDNGQRFCWVITVGENQESAFAIFEKAKATLCFDME